MAQNDKTILFASRAMESLPQEGGFVLLRDIAQHLHKKGLVPYMASSKKEKLGQIKPDKIYTRSGWDKLTRLQFFSGLLRRAGSYDIVHTAHIPNLSNSRLMRAVVRRVHKKGTRFVQTVTSLLPLPDDQLRKLLWGDVIVLQSPEAQRRVDTLGGYSTKLIVPWPAPQRVALNPSRRAETRRSLGLSETQNLVVFPGEFERMGIDLSFEECLKRFFQLEPDSLVILACRFDHRGIGDQLAARFPDKVRSVGKTSNIIELMEAADLVIFPTRKMDSKFHPPLIITEALSLGSSVLISDKIDLSETVSPLLKRVSSASSWGTFGEKMSEHLIRSAVGTKNNFSAMLTSYETIYREILKT
jgi:hypothetical protein